MIRLQPSGQDERVELSKVDRGYVRSEILMRAMPAEKDGGSHAGRDEQRNQAAEHGGAEYADGEFERSPGYEDAQRACPGELDTL